MTDFYNPFTGAVVVPTDTSYVNLVGGVANLYWENNGLPPSNTGGTPFSRIMELTSTGGGGFVYMPDATQGNLGADCLVTNLGPGSVDFYGNNANAPFVTLANGETYLMYLADTSTKAGVWRFLKFGAATAAGAAASTLVGANTTASIGSAGKINTFIPPSIQSASGFTLDTLGTGYIWTGGAGTASLSPNDGSGANGWYTYLSNHGSGNLVISPQYGTIDGSATLTLAPRQSTIFMLYAKNFYTIATPLSANFAPTEISIPVTGGTTTLTASQYANSIQFYTGTLTSDQTIILPTTAQVWYLSNQTTGAHSLTFTTNTGGTTATVPQGSQSILVCDGGIPANLYNANTAYGVPVTLSLGSGSAAAPSLSFAASPTTGFFLISAGHMGFASGGSQRIDFGPSSMTVTGGPNLGYWTGGAF